jgi:uncharacterized protein (DUF608 family)
LNRSKRGKKRHERDLVRKISHFPLLSESLFLVRFNDVSGPGSMPVKSRFPIFIALLLLFARCGGEDNTSRPEYSYSDKRVMDELRRLEQNEQIEEVLGHDTQRLKELLQQKTDVDPQEAKTLLIRCRDEYLKGLKNKSGVPLGGLGAGTIELWPDGGLHDWRIAENWDLAREAEFSCFAVRTDSDGRSRTRVLQDAPWAGRKRTREIKYDGRFPFVFLDYGAGEQPISVKARVFSSFIPHDAENSCLPVACFTFELTNTSDNDVRASLISAVGVSPFLTDGSAKFQRDEVLSTISFNSGVNSLALSSTSPTASHASGWTSAILPSEFETSGRLEGGKNESENGRIALCAEVDIEPKETKEIIFLLSWFFPEQRQRPTAGHEMEVKFKELGTTQKAEANKYLGRRYNKFGSLENINRYFVKNLDRMEEQSALWVETIYASSLDESLKHLLCNSVYPLFKTSFWLEDGRFNILESTNCCANPDCVHVRYYGSIPLVLFFPELDQQILRRFAKYRGPFGGAEAGQIPEQFYGFSLEFPFGRPLLQNNLSFVLMVYRDYLWTGDTEFLNEMWPAIRDAMDFLIRADTDEDGLPDNVGIKQSYDDYDMGDSPTYTSVMWLATLRAAEEMAALMRDKQRTAAYRELFARGRDTVENTLWNGQYYGLGEDANARVCFADALNGQWYADMLGLGDLLDAKRVQETLASIFRYNHPATPYGIVNGFIPGQGIDYPEQAGYFQTQAASVWPGTTFAVASLGLYRGFHDEPLAAAKEVHDNYENNLGNLWNMRESNDAESGLPMAWPFYYRPMSAWSVLLGLEGFRYGRPAASLTIAPPAGISELRAPVIMPGAMVTLDFTRGVTKRRLGITTRRGILHLAEVSVPKEDDGEKPAYKVKKNGEQLTSTLVDEKGAVRLIFEPELALAEKERLEIILDWSASAKDSHSGDS